MHTIAPFADTSVIMFAKLLIALLLGSAIGTERALLARQAAGMRTFGLVALGACLFVITSSAVDSAYLGLTNFDPMHLAMGIITGIGFIGGGVIIFRGDALHGVTTAAGLWIAAAIGMATGFGLYLVALFATALTLLILTGMWYIEDKFKHWFIERENGGHSAVVVSHAMPPRDTE